MSRSAAPQIDVRKRRETSWVAFRRTLRANAAILLMALPAVVLLFIFNYLPMIGLVIAFKDFRASKGLFGSEWVGLDNFRFLFGTKDAWRITGNTLLLNTLFIITNLVGSVSVALLLNEVRSRIASRFYQFALFIPYFISWVIVGYFGFAFLNTDDGLLNQVLAFFGVKPIRWYAAPQYWSTILTLVYLWKSIGFWSIIYLAGIIDISPEYYEAARLDGASKWRQITAITLPLLLPLILINVTLAIGRIFYADFGLFFNVTRDSSQLYQATDVIDTYVYRALRTTGDVGMASAAGFYQALVGFVLVLFTNWLVRRFDPDKALF